MKTKNWIKFIFLCIIWGTNFLWVRIIVKDIGPFNLVFFRILFACLTIFIYMITSGIKITLSWKKLGIYAALGIFNVTLPFLFTSWAEQSISSGLAGIISSTYPLFSLLFIACFLPEERITWFRSIGLCVGFLGVVILITSGFTEGKSTNTLSGVMVMVLAPISYAMALVFARRTGRSMDTNEQSFGQICIALITISISTVLFEPRFRFPSLPIVWAGVVWLGILCTGVGTILWYSLLNSVGATFTSLTAYVSPVIAMILGVLILSEEFSWQLVVGGLMVICGVIWVNSSGFRRRQYE